MGASEGERAGADPAGESQVGAAAETAGEARGESSSSSWAWDGTVSKTVMLLFFGGRREMRGDGICVDGFCHDVIL